MSPGWTSESETCGSEEYCAAAECGGTTPACAHAYDVSPEQSNDARVRAAPQTYGEPSTEFAAAIGDLGGASRSAAGVNPLAPVVAAAPSYRRRSPRQLSAAAAAAAAAAWAAR